MKYFLISLLTTGTLLADPKATNPDTLHIETYAEIREAASLVPISEEIEISNAETLVLLDIGKTLLNPTDPLFHECHEDWKKNWFEHHHPDLSVEEKRELARIVDEFLVMNDSSWKRDEEWPDLLKQAQMRNIKVIAFSKVVIDPTLKKCLSMRLANFGIPIQDDLPELSEKGTLFIYANGVIQTGEKFKGPVLKEVLSLIAQLPQKIIFVDDRKSQIESVHQTCRELGIPVVCFHYLGFNESPFLDEVIANYQLNTLVKNHRWVSVNEASKILHNPKDAH